MSPSTYRRFLPLGLLAPVLLLTAACDGAGNVPHRPSDGLLSDPALQHVVELQVARDGGSLTQALSDDAAAVRARAALALGSVQAPESLDGLVIALSDSSAAVRRDAAFALGQLGDAAAIQPLVDAFSGEPDGAARSRMLEALGKIRSLEAVSAVLDLSVTGPEEAERTLALARLGATRGVATELSQAHLMGELDSGNPQIRLYAAYYFGRLASPTPWVGRIARVREALDGSGSRDLAAMYLTQALGRVGNPADGGRLRHWATDGGDWRIRVNAASALAALPPDPDNREALLALLDDASAHVAVAAAQGLARGNPVPSELQRMKAWIDANPDRWQAAAPLLALLARADERDFVFGWLDALAPDDADRWSVALQALAFMPGVEAVERLQSAVASPSSRIQGGAVSALVQRWNQDRMFSGNHELYFQIFAQVLEGGSLQAAFSAAQALGDPSFAPFGSAEVLAQAYANMSAPQELEPMIAVLESLARTGTPEAVTILKEAARGGNVTLRAVAVRGLEGLEEDVPAAAPDETQEAQVPAEANVPSLDWAYLQSLGVAPVLVLETDQGVVRVRLATEEAPHTVQTVTRLASEGKYDGVPFHRVVPNFVAQGGDFSSGDGFGGPGFTITSEFTLIPFLEGVIGMASAGKDTEGSQFFITHAMQPHLDGGYTTFGWVVEGMDVVNALQVGHRIVRATVESGG